MVFPVMQIEYEVAGPKCNDSSSIALVAEGRVLLITDDKGGVELNKFECWYQWKLAHRNGVHLTTG